MKPSTSNQPNKMQDKEKFSLDAIKKAARQVEKDQVSNGVQQSNKKPNPLIEILKPTTSTEERPKKVVPSDSGKGMPPVGPVPIGDGQPRVSMDAIKSATRAQQPSLSPSTVQEPVDKPFWENIIDSQLPSWKRFFSSGAEAISEAVDYLDANYNPFNEGGIKPIGWYNLVQEAKKKGNDIGAGKGLREYADKQSEEADVLDQSRDTDSWGYFVGSMVPYTLGTATAIATAPVSGTASGLIGGASIGANALSAIGSGMQEYQNYQEEKGKEVDPYASLGVGLLYGSAEFAMEKLALDKFMPKQFKGKLGKMIFGSMPGESLEKTGKQLVEEFANSSKSRGEMVKQLSKQVAEGAVTEGGTEAATEIAQEFTNWLYQEKEDRSSWQEIMENTAKAAAGGALMGTGLGPLSYGSQRLVNDKRRKQSNRVVLAQNTKNGETLEIVGASNSTTEGKKKLESGEYEGTIQEVVYDAIRPNGKPIQISENEVGEVVDMPYDTFKNLLNGKIDGQSAIEQRTNQEVANEAITQQQEIEAQYEPFVLTDPLGNKSIAQGQFQGKQVFVTGIDPNNPNAFVITDTEGNKSMVDKSKVSDITQTPYDEFMAQNAPVEQGSVAPFDPSNPVQAGEEINFEGEEWVVTGIDTENGMVQLESLNDEAAFESIPLDMFQQLRKPEKENIQEETTPTEETGASRLREIFNPGDTVDLDVEGGNVTPEKTETVPPPSTQTQQNEPDSDNQQPTGQDTGIPEQGTTENVPEESDNQNPDGEVQETVDTGRKERIREDIDKLNKNSEKLRGIAEKANERLNQQTNEVQQTEQNEQPKQEDQQDGNQQVPETNLNEETQRNEGDQEAEEVESGQPVHFTLFGEYKTGTQNQDGTITGSDGTVYQSSMVENLESNDPNNNETAEKSKRYNRLREKEIESEQSGQNDVPTNETSVEEESGQGTSGDVGASTSTGEQQPKTGSTDTGQGTETKSERTEGADGNSGTDTIIDQLQSERNQLRDKVYTKSGKVKKSAVKEDLERLKDVENQLNKANEESISLMESEERDKSREETARRNKEFEESAYEGLEGDDLMMAIVEDKIQFNQELTSEELEWANKNMFLPEGSELNKKGNLIQKTGQKNTVPPKAKQPKSPTNTKTVSQLAEENKKTAPKIPSEKVFPNTVQNPTLEQRKEVDKFLDSGETSGLPLETVPVSSIVPTQKNLTIDNLKNTQEVTDSNEDVVLLKVGDQYFIMDGHHRIANEILKGNENVSVRVSEYKQPKPEKTTAKKEKKSPTPKTEKLEDYGEKIEGAAKDNYQKTISALESNSDQDLLNQPLSKSIPVPDYQKLIDDGVISQDTAIVLKYQRDMLGRKPTSPYKLSRWLQGVKAYSDIYKAALSNKDFDIYQSYLKVIPSYRKEELDNYIKLMKGLDWPKSGVDPGQYQIRFFEKYKRFNSGEAPKDVYTITKGRYIVSNSDTYEQAIDTLKGILALSKPKDGKKAVKFSVYQNRNTKDIYIAKKSGTQIMPIKKGFTTAKEAHQYIKDHQQELEQSWEDMRNIPDHRRATNSDRIGEDYRKGKDVTPEMLAETFGFRGVQFGNWVNNSERQSRVNDTYDSLMDLANVLNIPPKAIGLNGTLGMAFGARGKKGAAAHYEPGQIVINLTKKNGAGSLAHEWWHAMDNYFSRARDHKSGYVTESPYPSTTKDGVDQSVRPALLEAFRQINTAIDKSGIYERSRQTDALKKGGKSYYRSRVEMTARSFENYVIDRLDKQEGRNDFLANVVDPDTFERSKLSDEDVYPYLYPDEMEGVTKSYDKLFTVMKVDQSQSNMPLYMMVGNNAQREVKYDFIPESKDARRPKYSKNFLTAPQQTNKTPSKVQSEVDRISGQWKNGPKITVMENPDDILLNFPGIQFRDLSKVPAFYIDGEIVINASHPYHNRPGGTETTILHESIGHYGLHGFLEQVAGKKNTDIKSEYANLMKDVISSFWDTPMMGYISNTYFGKPVQDLTGQEMVEVAEEYIAHTAQTGVKDSLLDRIIAKVREILRNAGFKMKMADAELRSIIGNSYRIITGENGPMYRNDQLPEGVRSMIIGEQGANTLDRVEEVSFRMDNLQVAREMEQSGKDKNTIRLATGWERGSDGLWRYELGDYGQWKDVDKVFDLMLNKDGKTVKLSDIYDNKELYEAYPTLKDQEITFREAQKGEESREGFFDPESGSITILTQKFRQFALGKHSDDIKRSTLGLRGIRGIVVHELTHLIQNKEGFASGSSPEFFNKAKAYNEELTNNIFKADKEFGFDKWLEKPSNKNRVSELMAKEEFSWNEIREEFAKTLPENERSKYLNFIEKAEGFKDANSQKAGGEQALKLTPSEAYKRTAGEVEARNASARMRMSPEERGVKDLESTEDIAREDQIFLFGGGHQQAYSPDQTQSESFKEWFGDSKVVDDEGKPLVVYHGTASDFDLFELKKAIDKEGRRISMGWGKGKFYFSKSPISASISADWASKSTDRPGETPSVMPVYLSVKNPIKSERYEDLIQKEIDNGLNRDKAIDKVDKLIKKQGYDGIMDDVSDGIAVFNPTQIKSATGNNGQFSNSNPDIRYFIQDTPEIQSQRLQKAHKTASDRWTNIIEKYQDNMIRAKQLIESKLGKKVKDSSDFYTKENLAKGKTLVQTEAFMKDFYDPMIQTGKTMNKKHGVTMEEIGDYLYALHAPERNAYIKGEKPEIDFDPSGMSDEEAAAIREEFEKKVPKELRDQLTEQVQAINMFVNGKRLESGLISKAVFDELQVQYKNYVPLRGWEDLQNDDMTVYSPMMAAKGRKSKAGNPIPYLVTAAQEAIMKGENNKVRQSVLQFVKENPSQGEYQIRNSYYRKTGEQDENGNDIWEETTTRPPKEDFTNGNAVRSFNPDIHKAVKMNGRGDHVLPVMVNGKKVFIEFKDERISMAIKNTSQEKVPKLIQKLRAYTRWLSSMYTQYSPEFGVRNLLRDLGFSTFNILAEDGGKTWANTMKSIPVSMGTLSKNLWTGKDVDTDDGKLLKEFLDAGGLTGYSDLKQAKDVFEEAQAAINRLNQTGWWNNTKNFSKSTIETALKPIDVYNRTFENATRFSYYKTLRSQGLSPQKAAIKAKDLTVNFNRKGNSSSLIGSIYMFFNASVQGNERLLRSFFNPKTRKRAFGMMGSLTALGMAQSIMYGIMGGEDDDEIKFYDKIPEYVKRTNIIIPNPFTEESSDYFKIPLPYGINVFYSMGESIGRVLTGREEPGKASLGVLTSATDSFSPIGGFDFEGDDLNVWQKVSQFATPSALQPVTDLAFNRNFAGFQIYKEPFTSNSFRYPNSQSHFQSVNPQIKSLTDLLNSSTGGDEVTPGFIDINPEWIEYGMEQYFGGPVNFAKNVSGTVSSMIGGENILDDENYRKVPFVRNYLQKTGSQFDTQSMYYDFVNQSERTSKTYEKYLESGNQEKAKAYYTENKRLIQMYEMSKNYNKSIKSLTKAIHQASGTDKEKLYEKRADLMKKFNMEFNKSVNKPKRINSLSDLMVD